MKKKNSSKKTSSKQPINQKEKNLFNHLEAIREFKDKSYYDNLTDNEKLKFNHWSILHGLSMDESMIKKVSVLWKDGYYDKIPSNLFYKVLLNLSPTPTNKRLNWIKKRKQNNKQLLMLISQKFEVSIREAREYINLYLTDNNSLQELERILQGFGLTDKEIEALFYDKVDNN